MKCKQCGYALWNLTHPECPECGTPFDVQSYWFEPGSVVFKCPFCGQRHEGSGPRGLPFDAGQCAGCGRMLAVEQMAVEPVNQAEPIAPDHDDDFTLAGQRRSPARRRALLAALFAAAAVIAMFLIAWLVRSPWLV